MTARPAAGGGRWVTVAPERLATWIARFSERHGPVTAVAGVPVAGADGWEAVRLEGADGALAECRVPFPPLRLPAARVNGADRLGEAALVDGADGVDGRVAALLAHASRERTVGVLLVRLGGHAAGVFTGERLVVSKVGSRQVHGRSAAGGWSQQRFARRRDNQAAQALRAAAEVALRVLGPREADLDAVVLGGDRRAVDELREDRRLAPILALETGPFLTVPDPGFAVLRGTPSMFRAVRIRVVDPVMNPVVEPGAVDPGVVDPARDGAA
ncbi:hypothetical protein JOL79_07235 [Microbispora sp. RL4-1S]|uniref:Actinobacteria/chloroflexi VLRF1 release factor domain-containing protein n=1 Tax=Microbispora oryzae TaxID=2806554 RepID=A0A940WIU4_9ACTN|nr:acVLRF1 family peptidyl-tRNA hydrolase [Microbispora oryzae]MBP2703593.1 hypothetical protein [Microbispora oryzae]